MDYIHTLDLTFKKIGWDRRISDNYYVVLLVCSKILIDTSLF